MIVRDVTPMVEQAWLREAAAALAEVDPRGLLVGAAAVSAFAAGRYGPAVVPYTVDVVSAVAEECELLARARLRWRVQRCDDPTAAIAGLQAPGLRFGVRLAAGGLVSVTSDMRCVVDLAAGRLDVGPSGETDPDVQAVLGLFPALVEAGTSPLSSIGDVLREVDVRTMRRGRGLPTLSAPQERIVARIREWHATASPEVQVVPTPAPTDLPASDPWLAPDDSFREWLLAQTYGTHGDVELDPWLHDVLGAQEVEQKPTHLGWRVDRHALTTALLLDTEGLPTSDRPWLRAAALLHDIGKLRDVWTLGAHAAIGARYWPAVRPPFLTDQDDSLVTALIRAHDMHGIVDRFARDPGGRGVSPARWCSQLAAFGRPHGEAVSLVTRLYVADVGSVSTLRWLLPLTPLLEEFLLLLDAADEPVGS